MTGSIILYAARSPLTADHQAVYLPRNGGDVDAIYIRAVRVGCSPIDALDRMHGLAMDGETFLNSIQEVAE